MEIPVILQGDDSGGVTIALADGHNYEGATLVVVFNGVSRQYANLTAGGSVVLAFTADETAGMPLGTALVNMRLVGANGGVETVGNADARIKVTDCVAEVNAGGSFAVTPGGNPLDGVEGLGARYTGDQLRAKINEVIAKLGGTVAALLLCALPCLGGALDVKTAPFGGVYNDAQVVTNVELDVYALTNGWRFGSDVDLTEATNYTDAALGAFASTGTVARANVYGTPTRWTDATGCVWEVFRAWNFQNLLLYTPSGEMQWTVTGCLRDGYDWSSYVGYWLRYDAQGTNWIAHTDLYDPVDVSSSGGLNDDVVEIDGWGTFRAVYVTNLVGRVAYTNDIPKWPAELVHTNTPLIFVDGTDTNVTSLALRAQPTNYTSLSWMYPVSYYLPNRFSLLELGHDYQIAAAQWFQIGRYLYAQNPENIVFVGGGQHRSLQDYLDACSPQTMADLLSCYIPTNGGGRIHGDLTIDGRLTAGELITITNSDIHAKGFQVVNKVLTADGLMASNGMVRLNCARFALGFGTPRIHLETNDLSAITYGGTWEHPAGSVFSWQDEHIQTYLAGNTVHQDIELRNPYVRYMDVQNGFIGWKIKGHNVNNGPLKHFTLDNYRTHHFTDADVGNYGIEFTIASNAHVRIVYDFASAPPSAVYFFCGRDGNDQSATMLSNGTELLAPTAGAKTLFEIEHLSGWTFLVKETPLTYENTVMPWVQAQEEEP